MHRRIICVGQTPVNGASYDSLQALEQVGIQIHLLCFLGEQLDVL